MTEGPELPGLYLHIPFCKTKCPYCDFYSITDLSATDAWFKGLQREIEVYSDLYPCFDSFYIGGGTPSCLGEQLLEKIFAYCRRRFRFAPDTEITIEVNPDDITDGLLMALRDLGVNRLSIGVQSFHDKELRFLKRRSDVPTAKRALRLARTAGFNNIGIDLIYALPGQTEKEWLFSLEEAVAFAPEHLSCYELTVSKDTPFGRLKEKGRLAPPTEETGRQFFLMTSEFLRSHGYIHYEISNFARSPHLRSRHNRKYWHHVPYLGLGPGAHSFDGRERWWNYRSVDLCCQAAKEGRLPVEDRERLTDDQLALERLFLGIRTNEGVPLRDVLSLSGGEQRLLSLTESGLLMVCGDRVVPTTEGFLVADRLPLLIAD